MKFRCIALFVTFLGTALTAQAEVDCDAQYAKCVEGIPSFAECMNAYEQTCIAECDASGSKECAKACEAQHRASIAKRSNACSSKIAELKTSCEHKKDYCEEFNAEQ